ncbi:unnamed protein product [Symbiodinium natans]|uniref:Uncharacterized protein n=1 Tax=Symbiodinium natans TaxID=878477 RepID=A0A812NKH3_9DINO|nr:unnamed protein product [Symbiodinium natans]
MQEDDSAAFAALGTDLLNCIFWPVVRRAFLRVRQHPGLVAEMFYTALIRDRRDVRGPASRAWRDAQAFVSRNCVTAMSPAWHAAMITGRTATSGTFAAAGLAADALSTGFELNRMPGNIVEFRVGLDVSGPCRVLADCSKEQAAVSMFVCSSPSNFHRIHCLFPSFREQLHFTPAAISQRGASTFDAERPIGPHSSGSLDLVRDEPEHRLGNLGLYVRLVGGPPHGQEAIGGQTDRFVVEEDQRQRARLHWRSREASTENGGSRAWYVSSAFSPWEPSASVCETLGCEAVDWVWAGLNASILSVGLQADARDVLFSAPPTADGHSPGAILHSKLKCFTRDGLLGFAVQELCRHVDAAETARFRLGLSIWELDGNTVKDYFAGVAEDAHLPFGPFGVVGFATPDEALALWEATQEPQGHSPTASAGRGNTKHLFVRILVLDVPKRSMAALHLVQIAGSDASGKELPVDCEALQRLLRSLSSGAEPETSGGLPQALLPLLGGNCKPFLLCTVPERPGTGYSEVRDLLDVAERAALLITAQCKRVQGLPADAFRLVGPQQWLACRRVAAREELEKEVSLQGAPRDVASACAEGIGRTSPAPALTAPPALRGARIGSPRDDLSDVVRYERPLSAAASPVRSPGPGHSPSRPSRSPRPAAACGPGTDTCDRDSPGGPVLREAAAAEARAELAAAVATLRAKNRAKAERRQRELADIHAENQAILQEIEAIENATDASELLQAFRGEAQSLRKQVEMLKMANAFLAGLHGEDKRYAAQKEALKTLQQEASQLSASRNALEKGERRAGLVQRCLEEVHARLDTAKKRKLEAEEEISRLRPAYAELGRQLEVAETERRWLQGELDKMRQTASGLRTEISQLLEVRGAINALPPQDVSVQRKGAGFAGSLERFAALQRRLATAAPHLMPLCTRARSEMEDLVQCIQKLEERQRRLQQVAPQCGVPLPSQADDGLAASEASVASRKGTSARRVRSTETIEKCGSNGVLSDVMGLKRQSQRLLRSPGSAETLGARSARSSVTGTPGGAWRAFASPSASTLGAGMREADRCAMQSDDGQPEGPESSPCSSCQHCGRSKPESSIRACCVSCGAVFAADAQFCQQCGSKRYQEQVSQASVRTRSVGIRSTAGTLQDLGIQVPPGQATDVQVHLAKAKAAVPRATPGWNSARRTAASKS